MTLKRTFKKLVISPHADDEVLGCASIMDNDTFVYYCGLNEEKVNTFLADKDHRLSLKEKIKEIELVAKLLGFSWGYNPDSFVNNYVEQQLIGVIEKLIEEIKPEIIYIPNPSYNQDHRNVYSATIIALRPHDRNHFVKKVLVYEGPQDIHWGNISQPPNYFVELDIDKKLKAYSLYKSQVRGMRSFDLVKSIACVRGSSIGRPFAESFFVLRWLD